MHQQGLQFSSVKTYDDLTVNPSHRSGHVPDLFKLSQRGLVGRNVSLGELDLVLGKKLFHLAAKDSPWLAIKNHFFRHGIFPLSLI
jgi:hypothetical protein